LPQILHLEFGCQNPLRARGLNNSMSVKEETQVFEKETFKGCLCSLPQSGKLGNWVDK